MESDDKMEQPLPDELVSIIEEIEATYWVPTIKTPFATLEKLQANSDGDPQELKECINTFYQNLKAARELLEFPYTLLAPLLPEVKAALHSSNNATSEGGLSEPQDNGSETILFVTSALKGSKRHITRSPQLQRIMHQACLLIWSAIEIYARDMFVAVLNKKPALYSNLLLSTDLKDRFAISANSWTKHLEHNDYNLNGRLGSIVASNRDFSSPSLVCELFQTLFQDKKFVGFPEDIFKEPELLKLGHRRNLVAHKCGIIDKEYLNKTKDDQKLGELLRLRGRDVGMALGAVASYAILIYANAQICWSDNEVGEQQ